MRTTSTLMIIVLTCAIALGFLIAQTDWVNPESTMAQVRRMDVETKQLEEKSRLEMEERLRKLEADTVAAQAEIELQRQIALGDAQHRREMRELVTLFGIALVGAVTIIITVGVTFALMQRVRQMDLQRPTPLANENHNGLPHTRAKQKGRLHWRQQKHKQQKHQQQESLLPEGAHL